MRSRSASSRSICARTASRRSQSTIRRWTSGSGIRRRSGRGGKRPTRSAAAAHSLALLELLPHQETVRQQHQHTVAVKAGPQSPLILVPAQQLLGLFVKLLHPVPAVGVLHHPLQRRVGTEVAPVVPPLAIRAVLAEQPADPPSAVRQDAPTAQGRYLGSQPTVASLAPTDRPPHPGTGR